MDRMTKSESEKIDESLAKFFYACNVPFHSIDSNYFKEFLHALRPSYKPPNRKKIG